MGFLVSAAIAWVGLAGCGGHGMKTGSRDANASDGGASDLAVDGGSLTTGSADSSSGDAGAGQDAVLIDLASDGSGTDAVDSSMVDSGAGLDAADIPQEIPSRQKVTFRVSNGGSVARYVAARADGLFGGPYCSAYGIGQGTTNLTLAIPSQCGCECPAPHQPGVTELWRISPGQSKDLVWDARALATYSTMMKCGTLYPGGPEDPSAKVLHGVWQPVAAGSYQVTLIIKSTVPSSCQEANDIASCDYWTEDQYGAWSGGICDRTTTVEADFELPAEGDVIVPMTTSS